VSIPIDLYKERYALQQKQNRSPEEEKELADMLEFERKLIEEQDASWRRRMASRTPEEVARGVIAPG
jgi:hypothetical protein